MPIRDAKSGNLWANKHVLKQDIWNMNALTFKNAYIKYSSLICLNLCLCNRESIMKIYISDEFTSGYVGPNLISCVKTYTAYTSAVTKQDCYNRIAKPPPVNERTTVTKP